MVQRPQNNSGLPGSGASTENGQNEPDATIRRPSELDKTPHSDQHDQHATRPQAQPVTPHDLVPGTHPVVADVETAQPGTSQQQGQLPDVQGQGRRKQQNPSTVPLAVDRRPHGGGEKHAAKFQQTAASPPQQETPTPSEPPAVMTVAGMLREPTATATATVSADEKTQTRTLPYRVAADQDQEQKPDSQHGGGDDGHDNGPRSSEPAERRAESLLLTPLTHPNGQSMFPSMSTSEQSDMAREALSQAEASIVADSSEEERLPPDESDGGYDSDGFSSGSTTAESSVRDYLYENGRRYHRFREGSYNFPNDDVEQEREDMKHAMVKLLCSQKLHFAPIGNHPQEVLDMGTGTGIWAIEMGDQFPSAHVLGIDLSPIQPDWLPPNVRFMVDDIESPWLHPRNHFDYIHSRHTVMAIKDWMRLFRRALEHLKPGGWIELQEIHHRPKKAQASGTIPPEHPVVQFWARVTEGLNALGVNLDMAAGGLLARMMRDAGFVNVTERVFHVPIGTWPKNKVLKTVGLYWRTILLDGIQAIALGPLTRGLQWSRDEVELFLMEVRRAYHDNAALMYMPLHVIYAQKPESTA
ncbi:hypothetical protein DCS_01790 [Drechmeria coniospora]|uniref:Methyltransferase type 12 n=1 Tax=Drechmeria coniospora TaxID=98403 RepID=A0A151GUF7_DRECN|nr:hypothetical protein DCS_01790 [Drechmeria coniospora]KYK60652.1 hypothetical protein DCS_01790 [Drechmeria coniospora]